MPSLSDVFVVSTKNNAQLNANTPVAGANTQVSTFVTAQSFGTFAVAAPVLKTIWEVIKTLPWGWVDSYWTPMALCLIYGGWQFIISVTGRGRVKGFPAILSALIIGIANAGILAGAIIGLTETTGVGET